MTSMNVSLLKYNCDNNLADSLDYYFNDLDADAIRFHDFHNSIADSVDFTYLFLFSN